MVGYDYELNALQNGYRSVCGIDEAGRGPLAGPVFAAAVILPEGLVIDGLDDSKKLSEKKRERLFDVIKECALDWSVASASHNEIDELNILNASMLAMKRAAQGLTRVRPDFALIDGNRVPDGLFCNAEAIIGGDAKSASIAAASVLAKVSRDRFMITLDEKYPEYEFARHKGYPTALHRELLLKYGPCEEHRRTFLKKILG